MAGAKRAWNRPSDVRRGQVRRSTPYLSGWFMLYQAGTDKFLLIIARFSDLCNGNQQLLVHFLIDLVAAGQLDDGNGLDGVVVLVEGVDSRCSEVAET